jgi:hypothetical protein
MTTGAKLTVSACRSVEGEEREEQARDKEGNKLKVETTTTTPSVSNHTVLSHNTIHDLDSIPSLLVGIQHIIIVLR